MAHAGEHPETRVTPGEVPLSWLLSQRRTAALQLEALAPRGARHRTARAVELRRRVRLLDAQIARRSGAAVG